MTTRANSAVFKAAKALIGTEILPSKEIDAEIFCEMFTGGSLEFYTGKQPEDPDAIKVEGDFLGRVAVFIAGNPSTTGLTFVPEKDNSQFAKSSKEYWRLDCIAEGKVGWARLTAREDLFNLDGTIPSLDMAVGLWRSPTDLWLAKTDLLIGDKITIDFLTVRLNP
jgi:hypothetical protein